MSTAVSSACDSLLNAQQCMSWDADKARRDKEFHIGEFVLLSIKFLRLTLVGRNTLLNKYLGSFEIVARKGAVADALSLPASMSKMHPVSCVLVEAVQGWLQRFCTTACCVA